MSQASFGLMLKASEIRQYHNPNLLDNKPTCKLKSFVTVFGRDLSLFPASARTQHAEHQVGEHAGRKGGAGEQPIVGDGASVGGAGGAGGVEGGSSAEGGAGGGRIGGEAYTGAGGGTIGETCAGAGGGAKVEPRMGISAIASTGQASAKLVGAGTGIVGTGAGSCLGVGGGVDVSGGGKDGMASGGPRAEEGSDEESAQAKK
eukprot:Gb_32258 [translate_table: standard]